MNHQMDDETTEAPAGTSEERVRKVIEEACGAAGALVAIETRMDASDKSRAAPAQHRDRADPA